MNEKLVTVITPCYNGELFLKDYFESILAQTYTRIQLILVNDGSTDSTDIIIRKYKDLLEKRDISFVYLQQENGGQAKAMNAAFQYMQGEYLVWPDSDDLLSPDSIKKKVEFLENNPDYSFVRTNGSLFDFESKKILRRISNDNNRYNEDIYLDLILEETYCCCGCYMIRTNVLKEFYSDLKIYESRAGQNWQILIPIASKYRCGYIDEDLYYVAVRSNSHSRTKRDLWQIIERYTELKKILEITIGLSGRDDRDYFKILNIKYMKIFMDVYLRYGELELAKSCFMDLKELKALNDDDIYTYLAATSPVLFYMFRVSLVFKRIIKKVFQ